jgi:hypothetical protein
LIWIFFWFVLVQKMYIHFVSHEPIFRNVFSFFNGPCFIFYLKNLKEYALHFLLRDLTLRGHHHYFNWAFLIVYHIMLINFTCIFQYIIFCNNFLFVFRYIWCFFVSLICISWNCCLWFFSGVLVLLNRLTLRIHITIHQIDCSLVTLSIKEQWSWNLCRSHILFWFTTYHWIFNMTKMTSPTSEAAGTPWFFQSTNVPDFTPGCLWGSHRSTKLD